MPDPPERLLERVAALAADLGPALAPVGQLELLRSITAAARELFDAAACSLALLDEAQETLTFHVASGAGAQEVVGQRVPVDRPSLEQLAETTRGHYYEAASLPQLKQVYQDMGSSIGYKTAPREITQWYVAVALLLALGAGGMSLLWTSRLP